MLLTDRRTPTSPRNHRRPLLSERTVVIRPANDPAPRGGTGRYDLRFLAREIKRRAYAPFAIISEEEFDRSVAALHRDIPGVTSCGRA